MSSRNYSHSSLHKITKQSIAHPEHWMSHVMDKQFAREMTQLDVQCTMLRFMLNLSLGSWHNGARSCGLVVLEFWSS